jgi:hypothetical protein
MVSPEKVIVETVSLQELEGIVPRAHGFELDAKVLACMGNSPQLKYHINSQ